MKAVTRMVLLASCLMPTVSVAEPLQADMRRSVAMVRVTGGCFVQGSDTGSSNQRPAHEVCLSDYFIGRYEVTQKDWQQIMGYNPSRFPSCGPDCPVDNVSWSDAREFIIRLNEATGKRFRLPTEAEWEFACRERGGDITFCGDRSGAWIRGNSDGKPHPVGSRQPNSLGLYDMSGNVWEWVHDWHDVYPATPQKNPYGAPSGSTKGRRGGSWQYDDEKSGAAWRSSGYADDRSMDIGFRLAGTAAD